MKLHYLAIAAVTAISANIDTASAAVSFSFTLLHTYLYSVVSSHITSRSLRKSQVS